MTPQEFERLAPREKNEVARRIYDLMIWNDRTNKKICPTCGDSFPEDSFVDVNGEGFRICPRCIFVLALYKQAGVEKQVFQGRHDLNPDRLNARFRKILDEDYYRNPAEAYRKYLPEMIEAEEVEMRIIHVTEEQFRKVESGSFPFLLFTDADVAKYRLGKSVQITLEAEGKTALKRTIYAMHKMPGRFAKKIFRERTEKECVFPAERIISTKGGKMFTVGEKVKIGRNIWTVRKIRPGEVLLRGWGSQKWYDIEQVKNAMEKGVDLK